MEIVGMMVVGPNEPYLEEVLEKNFKRLGIKKVYVATNNADKNTQESLRRYGARVFPDNREWGKYQPYIKSGVLKQINQETNADWILVCDADEIFDETLTREKLEQLAQLGGIAWNFYVVNYWNDTEHYAKGLSFWNVRFFKLTPEYGLDFAKKPVHCGLAPPMQYRYANDSPYILWHYGLMDKERRLRKVERYKKYDPNAAYKSDIYYQALASETPPASLDKEDMRRRVREDVENRKMKGIPAKEDKEGFVYMEREGRTIDVPAKDQRRYERQGWRHVSDVNLEVDEAFYEKGNTTVQDIEEEEKPNNWECNICGKENKSQAGMMAHKRRVH